MLRVSGNWREIRARLVRWWTDSSLSPGGIKIASGSDNQTVRIWNAATGKQSTSGVHRLVPSWDPHSSASRNYTTRLLSTVTSTRNILVVCSSIRTQILLQGHSNSDFLSSMSSPCL
ncbi:hypothetical protein BDR06DRAFT_204542 [Suillus hirtellus]|nr:hypothetical protein BDR06DRAFT_204542 [Suillus hirtellus]